MGTSALSWNQMRLHERPRVTTWKSSFCLFVFLRNSALLTFQLELWGLPILQGLSDTVIFPFTDTICRTCGGMIPPSSIFISCFSNPSHRKFAPPHPETTVGPLKLRITIQPLPQSAPQATNPQVRHHRRWWGSDGEDMDGGPISKTIIRFLLFQRQSSESVPFRNPNTEGVGQRRYALSGK